MPLLLDDEEDCMCRPHKAARVEPLLSEPSPALHSVAHGASALGPVSTEGKSSTSAPLEVCLRGGNGMEKMAAFAFGGEQPAVKFLSADLLTSSSSLNASDRLEANKSPESLTPALKGGSQPSTVAKTMFCSTQTLSQDSDVGSSTFSVRERVDSLKPSPPQGRENTGHSSSMGSLVTRQLFHEGDGKGIKEGVTAVPPVVRTNDTHSEPKLQMKLTDFFSQMACTRKK